METVNIVLAGQPIKVCVPNEYIRSNWLSWESGENESELFDFIETFSSPDAAFFDIGAWIGCATLPAAKIYRKVYSFEAESYSFSLLKDNVELNKIENVELYQRFVSDDEGPVEMYAPGDIGVSNSSGLHSKGKHRWTAQAMRIDHLIAAELETGPVVIKMDIEGAEYRVIPTLNSLAKSKNLTAVSLSMHPFMLAGLVSGKGLIGKIRRRGVLFKKTMDLMEFIRAFENCNNADGKPLKANSLLLDVFFRGGLQRGEREIYLSKQAE